MTTKTSYDPESGQFVFGEEGKKATRLTLQQPELERQWKAGHDRRIEVVTMLMQQISKKYPDMRQGDILEKAWVRYYREYEKDHDRIPIKFKMNDYYYGIATQGWSPKVSKYGYEQEISQEKLLEKEWKAGYERRIGRVRKIVEQLKEEYPDERQGKLVKKAWTLFYNRPNFDHSKVPEKFKEEDLYYRIAMGSGRMLFAKKDSDKTENLNSLGAIGSETWKKVLSVPGLIIIGFSIYLLVRKKNKR